MARPSARTLECGNCGYRGSVVVEDNSARKKVREAKKMERLSLKKQLR